MDKVRCAGVALVTDDNHIAIVKTHKGFCSLPKGKREKNEDTLSAAIRELHEETGLTSDKISILDDVYFIENSNKGEPSIKYFAARCQRRYSIVPQNPEELELAEWIPLVELTKQQIHEKRRIVFTQIQAYFEKAELTT